MIKNSLLLALTSLLTTLLFSQSTDSLVIFSDLKYHSDFERIAINNFVHQKKDTFDLFLAIDEKMEAENGEKYYSEYLKIFDRLTEKKIETKPISKKVRITYTDVHNAFLKKYNDNEYFPVMLESGTYNCVTASALFAMVFEHLQIPYKIMASTSHVYLIANPGKESIVIETTNPGFEQAIFTGEYKQQYVNHLRNSKLISESEYKTKSTEEIFEAHFKEVQEAKFFNLPGFQYYNKALTCVQNNNYKDAVELCQKAYFFFPDERIEPLLYSVLLLQIEKCTFDKITDIDYLAQLSRFENTEANIIAGIFNNIIAHYLQYTDKEGYCNSLFQRLSSQINNQTILEELSFSYFLQMSYRFQNTSKVEYYIENALKLKGNHIDAIQIMKSHLYRKLSGISDNMVLLDTIQKLELKYNNEQLLPVINEFKLVTYLKIASDNFGNSIPKVGEEYLKKFEESCIIPIESQFLEYWIEDAYMKAVLYYYRKNNKTLSQAYATRGLKYVPGSDLVKMYGVLK